MRILIVGDGQLVRARLRMLLLEVGIRQVTWAVSANAALRSLSDPGLPLPNAIIVEMKSESGFELEFYQAVRMHLKQRNVDVPILLLADTDVVDVSTLSTQMGDDAILSKRVNRETLRAWLLEFS
jgi:PleD family two-component response regulator